MKMSEMLQIALDLAGLEAMPEDSGVIYDNGKDIQKVLAGIDMSAAELMIAKQLGFDCVAQHHPNGIVNKDSAMLLARDHTKKMIECGVPCNVAQKLAYARVDQMHKGMHGRNMANMSSVAKLLDINDLALHTPADILAERYTQKVMDQLMEDKPGCTCQDVIDQLMTIREYQGAYDTQKPEIWVGNKDSYAGKIYVVMYGVGAPNVEEYNAMADAGIGTFVTMHATKEVIEGVKKHNKANLIIAGHMSSDSLGFNQILDAWEAKGVEIVRINGII